MYKYFLCLRYLRRRRIAFFAVAAVCLCVAMVLIVVSVMGGFLQMVKDRSRGMLGDLVVDGPLQGFPYYDEFIDRMKTDLADDIFEATPVIISYGVLRFPHGEITNAVQIVGIRLDETYRVNDFKNGLFYEKYYPGTTTFAPQGEPAYGYSKKSEPDSVVGWILDKAILPPEFEKAWQAWSARASPEELAEVPIDTRTEYERPGLFRRLPMERLPLEPDPAWLEPELDGIIIGTDLCARRTETGEYERYNYRGEKVVLVFVPFTASGQLTDATGPRRRAFRYVDDSRTGIFDIDSISVYVDFDQLQTLLDMTPQQIAEEAGGGVSPARATQIQIKLKPGIDPLAARDRLIELWDKIASTHYGDIPNPSLLGRVQIRTWEEKQARFIAAVEKEKYLVTILFGVISVVAVFLVGCIFHMIVQQKTRDIGVIKSIGATAWGVAGIFLAYGAAVGIVGGALGSIVGTLFVRYINEFQDLLARINPAARIWSPEVYSFDRIPSQVNTLDVVVIYLIAIAASMAGSVLAARKAAKVWPVEALRYE